MDRVQNARIRDLCGIAKGVGARIDVSVRCLFCRIERMENDRIAKRVCESMWVFARGSGGLIP